MIFPSSCWRRVGDFYLGSIEKEKAHDHRIMSCAF
nr:MAG TPA: hypothetical protein [Siphoviridae sp. ct6662]DAO71189.1 MAG TPA: hypothetical protein [Caudoviricetes sp.]